MVWTIRVVEACQSGARRLTGMSPITPPAPVAGWLTPMTYDAGVARPERWVLYCRLKGSSFTCLMDQVAGLLSTTRSTGSPPDGCARSPEREKSAMGPLTSEASETCEPPTSPATCEPTSSPASEDGTMPCVLPDGPITIPCGPEAAHASRSAAPAIEPEPMTLDIFGPSSSASSESADLQLSLESRLRALTDTDGSPEFALIMESEGYRFGAADLPAACVCAPHIRQRLFWVADAERAIGTAAARLTARCAGTRE